MQIATQHRLNDDEEALSQQLHAAESALVDLQADLESVEAEWEALAQKRVQYRLLEDACQSIEKLAEADLSRVFWQDRASDDEVDTHLSDVRSAIEALAGGVAEIEARRAEARRKVNEQLDSIAWIEGDLIQAVEAEERRRQEWLVERAASELPPRLQILPWARHLEDDRRFRRSLLGTAAACLLLGLIVPFIDIPIPEREEVADVPERFARLIRKEPVRAMPEAPPVQQRKVEEKPPEIEPDVKPEVMAEPVPETQVAETRAPDVAPEAPRDRVASTGLLAFRETFSSLASGRPSARLGSEARVSNDGQQAVGLPERSMVGTSAPGSSGGINLADLSRDVGSGSGAGDQIDGVQLSRVASSIGSNGGNDRPLSAGALAGRTDEEIQIVFDRYKAALYRLYNRELRKDPSLRGQMVLRLTIEPDGRVSLCQLQSSDMEAPMLADQVVNRVLGFDFGAKEVPAMTILYPIDFLPTA